MFGIIETGEDENENKGGASCDIELPTIEQLFETWNKDFDILLSVSENYNENKLKDFEKDPLKYIRNLG